MARYIEIVAASQSRLPPPCPTCLWWQTTRGTHEALERRLEWMSQLEGIWGSVGMVLLQEETTLAAVQFAPVRALARAHCLPPGPPPEDGILMFCLRSLNGRPSHEAKALLNRSMHALRRRRVHEVYAFARPLGDAHVCGVRNMCGLEFLEASGFRVVSVGGGTYLMKCDLRTLIESLRHAGETLIRPRGQPATPTLT